MGPMVAGLIAMAVSGVLFGGLDGALDSHRIGTSTIAQVGADVGHNTDDVFRTLKFTFGIMLCAVSVAGLFLLGVSRFAARRNLRYDNDPLAALVQQVRRSPQR